MAEETTECSLSLIDNLKQACNEDFLSLATRVFQRKQALIRSFPNLEEGVTSRSWENAGHSSNADSSLAQTDSADEVEVVNDTESVTSPELPPKAALYRPPLEVGKVYIVKKISSRRNEWSKALLLSIIYNVRKGVTNNRCLVKYSDGTISSRHVEASEVAYLEDCPTMIPVGTAVVTNTTSSNVAHYYAGVVLELPNALNNFRYLVFLDKGSVCYTHHNELRVICDVYQAHNAHTIDRYFVRDWLSFYPDRFLSKFKIGEKAEVKRRSGWAEGTVQCVDCSIVQLRFSDGSLEWYSRGSYKFKKIIYGQPSSSHPPKYLQRLQRIREKNALEMNQEPEDGPSLSQTQLVPARSLSTHRIPSLPQHSVSDPLKMITPLLSWWPKDLGMHACNTSCVPGEEIIKRIDPKYGVLVWPLCIGFKRQNQGFMSYKAPCGQVLKNYAQLRRFLDRTKLSLNYEHFDFSTRINALRVYDPDPNSILASLDDISNGLEKCSISCINEVNNQLPETIAYMTKRKFLTYSDELMSNCGDFVSCCSCEDDCKDPAKCECIQLTINSYLAVDDLDKPLAPSEIVYQYKRLLNEVRSGIYECNQRCKCSSACPNRLVQFPLSAQLQLFQTGKKGWGVRALHDLPKGSFVCTYVGVLLNEREANEWGILHGDEYLSDLDFIEKQESFKPGYEDSVAELSDANASSSTGVANTRSSELDQRLQSEENDHEPPKRRRSSRAHSQTPVETKKRRTTSKKRVDQEFPRGSIKRFFPADFSEFTIDAKNAGNIGRYFNHACVPNMFVQNVFVDTHDLRLPWVAFFTLTDVIAGTELTWDYGYSVGSVAGKRLYCYCLANGCKRRLY